MATTTQPRKPSNATSRPKKAVKGQFDFISDRQLRVGLESDYREMQQALSRGMWKAAHVLAGSILEAVLCDFLIACDYQVRTGIDPSTLDLGKCVEACFKEKALSSKARDMASVVREYRNLIHPGRAKRLEESVSCGSAKAVTAVLDVAIEEVTKKKQQIYGLTADQVLKKLEIDASAVAMLRHLLHGIRPYELERLLLEDLPATYAAETLAPTRPHLRQSLVNAFHIAFDIAGPEAKKRVASRCATIVREQSDEEIQCYLDQFFRAHYLKYMSEPDLKLVRSRLLLRLSTDTNGELLGATQGIQEYLKSEQYATYLDYLIRCQFWGRSDVVKKTAASALNSFVHSLPEDGREVIFVRLEDWATNAGTKFPEVATSVNRLKTQLALTYSMRMLGQVAKVLLKPQAN